MARLEISLLGPLRVALDGQPVTGLSLSRARALLAYLAVECDRAHPRTVLADLLWPDSDETSALTNLRHVLAQHGQPERAVEVYALASQHPQIAASRWWADVAGRHVAAAAMTLTPEVLAAARKRGQARELQATLQELSAELAS